MLASSHLRRNGDIAHAGHFEPRALRPEKSYLTGVALPAITQPTGPGALFTAQSIPEILAIATDQHLPARAQAWCILWPRVATRQLMVTSDTRGPIDDAIARQIGQIKWPANEGVLPRNSWKRWGGGELIEALAVQFPWVRETVAVTVARKGLEPVAVLGIAGKAPDRLAEDVLSMLMAATENLARSEELQQTAAMYQWLFGSAKKPVVIVREDGDIVAGTDSGLHLLQVAEFGDGRSPVSSVEQAVPTDIMSDVCCWLVSTKRGISIKGTPFGRGNLDLAEPLIVLELSLLNTKKTNVLLAQPEEALTPAQTDVYRLLIRGLLYKEISQHLHISPHTVHRHVCEILRRLHCSDRVDLLAKTIQKGAAAGPNVPASSDR